MKYHGHMVGREACLVLAKVVAATSDGIWLVRAPLYFSPELEEVWWERLLPCSDCKGLFAFYPQELARYLADSKLGFDWTDLSFFAGRSKESIADIDTAAPDVVCQIAIQCIDSSDWIFETVVSSVERILSTELFTIGDDEWKDFPPRYRVAAPSD